jgi:ATP-dependent RNA helicase DeaD
LRRYSTPLRRSGAPLLFSATMPAPDRRSGARYQKDAPAALHRRRGARPRRHRLPAMSVAPAARACGGQPLRLHEAESALCLRDPENVRRLIPRWSSAGFSAVALSGEHSQNERNQALQALRDGGARVLVATDVAGARHRFAQSQPRRPRRGCRGTRRPSSIARGRTGRAGRRASPCSSSPIRGASASNRSCAGARIEVEWIKPPTARGHPPQRPRPAARRLARSRPRSRRRIATSPAG